MFWRIESTSWMNFYMEVLPIHIIEPSDVEERIDTVDMIRGFALIGIFFVNIPDMWGKGYAFVSGYVGTDSIVRLIYDMLIQTKFYTLFSFLFGLSFYLFMQRAEKKGLRPKKVMMRRLVFLLIFGAIHFYFIWFGDILMTYAINGFLLLLFYGRHARTILISSLCLFGISLYQTPYLTWIQMKTISEMIINSGMIFGSIFDSVPRFQERVDFFIDIQPMSTLKGVPEILSLFLLGLYAGMKGWFTKDGLSERLLVTTQRISLLVSILFFVPMIMNYLSSDVYTPDLVYHYTYLSGKTLAICYLVTLVRIARSIQPSHFRGLVALGRMAFTNYLTQSIITMLLFHLFWSPHAGTWPLWTYTIYAVGVLAVQMAWSMWWLKRYRMGPLEWIWRAGTYGKQPMLRKNKLS